MNKIISEEQLKKYQKLCKELLHKDISKKEALKQGLKLINLYETLIKHKKNLNVNE
jgi:hypothetical protein